MKKARCISCGTTDISVRVEVWVDVETLRVAEGPEQHEVEAAIGKGASDIHCNKCHSERGVIFATDKEVGVA